MTTNTSASPIADREIAITRTFDAPCELVFEAFTDPKHIVEWWGPDGFTTTTIEADIRPGGVWRFIMHGPDGVDYNNVIQYVEIVPPERLVYEHGDGAGEIHFSAVVTFADEDGKTRVTMSSLFPTAEARDYVVREFHAIEGGKQHLERLSEFLAARQK